MSAPVKIVLLRGSEDDCATGASMKFRLYYEGELRPTQRDPEPQQRDRLASHKQAIRRQFHKQLRELWRTNQFLHSCKVPPSGGASSHSPAVTGIRLSPTHNDIRLENWLASQYRKFGYSFIPLVRDEISLLCSLDILFLRRDIPGSVIQAGDIDNRIKTLIDALRAPNSPNELAHQDKVPSPDETPFYCLLWDDKQVSHLSVETDTLLDPLDVENAEQSRVRLVITVELRPYYVTMFNLAFAGS